MTKARTKTMYITTTHRGAVKEVIFPVPEEFAQWMTDATRDGLIKVHTNNKSVRVSIKICDYANEL